jgi:hypothetical protein
MGAQQSRIRMPAKGMAQDQMARLRWFMRRLHGIAETTLDMHQIKGN